MMTYIIVYKDGHVRRFINVNYCDVCNTVIILFINNNHIKYTIRKEDIASVVFYP